MTRSEPVDRYLSPLRYPGGKARLARFVAHLVADQSNTPRVYIEPFAGGAAVGLHLLLNEYVDEIVLNDLDPGVASFWRAVFSDTEDLVALIESTPATVDEWHSQHERYMTAAGDDLELGFATFFLNRTNRSGILDARPIGGFAQQGAWSIDVRYNTTALIDRIRRVARYASRITVLETDGIELVRRYAASRDAFIYADPPYLNKSDDLYLNALTWTDHCRLARYLRKGGRWLLTYDDDPRVPADLYPGFPSVVYDIAHMAGKGHIGREYAVFAPSLKVTTFDGLGRGVISGEPTRPS